MTTSTTKRRSFTIIEILAVMVIILVLVGMMVAAGGGAKTKARKSKTQAHLKAIEVALTSYNAAWGYYPQAASPIALPATVDYATPNWWASLTDTNGKLLIQFDTLFGRETRVTGGGKTTTGVVNAVDAFGNTYHYECPGTMNPEMYDLWSYGPDGVNGGQSAGADASDDITNWKRNY